MTVMPDALDTSDTDYSANISNNDPSAGGAATTAPPTAPPSSPANWKLPPGWVLDTPANPTAKPSLNAAALAKEPNPIVRMLVQGDYDPVLMRRFKPEEQQAILQKAQQYDPGIDLSNYPAKAQAKKAFTSGKAADAIRSINQFLGHANSLADAEAALNNSDGWFPTPINWIENNVGSQFSPDLRQRLGTFEPIKSAVGNEFENMMRGSSVSGVKERLDQLNSLSPNSAPSSIKGWINGAMQVMNSRLNELNDQYKQGTGLQYGFDALNPQSKMILRRFGVNPEGAVPNDGSGSSGSSSGGSNSAGTYQVEKSNVPGGQEMIYYPPGMQPNASLRSNAPKQLTPELAQQYLQRAGGNKDKARMLARGDGYTF